MVNPAAAGPRERFEALARAVRDGLSQRWVRTEDTYDRENPKRVYYLSMEYLLGRSLANNVTNLLLDPLVQHAVRQKNLDWLELLEQEPDAGLGNGGLGRLAACFLDSMATIELAAMGYGLRYEYGMFRQSIKDGWQCEQPDNWLRRTDPWEVVRPYETVEVELGCGFELRAGALRVIPGRRSCLIGIPFDRPVVGYGGKTINTLRLWAAASPAYFDFQRFSSGDFVGALAETLGAESLTRVLYPDDSTSMGQGLRFVQEYFLVACSLADLLRRFRRAGADWSALPEKVAIQLNDTHPALAVPELMRILLDDAHLGWEQAWDLTRRTLAYTNHTLLPEALEKWPLGWFERLLPRHLEIVFEINRRLLDEVRARFAGDESRAASVSLIEEGAARKVRMANLAIVGSHSTNGVAAIHSELLRTQTVRPGRNVSRAASTTRPTASRRGASCCWQTRPWLTHDHRGHRRLDHRPGSTPRACTRLPAMEVSRRLRVPSARPSRFASWLKSASGQEGSRPDAIFDCQVKRIHSTSGSCSMRCGSSCYNRLRPDPDLDVPPRTFFFAGKAAPAYRLAKLIIKFINNLALTIDGDGAVRGRMKVR